jgi:hypothetical protein
LIIVFRRTDLNRLGHRQLADQTEPLLVDNLPPIAHIDASESVALVTASHRQSVVFCPSSRIAIPELTEVDFVRMQSSFIYCAISDLRRILPYLVADDTQAAFVRMLLCDTAYGRRYVASNGLAQPNISNRSGDRVLHIAARNGALETLRVLIEQGADLQMTNHRQETALHLATRNKHTAVVAFLCSLDGAPKVLNSKDVERNTGRCRTFKKGSDVD